MDQAAAGQALRKYLIDPRQFGVIAVKGPWGCGKTYLWQQTQKWLTEESDKRDDPKPLYCSLFGRDSVTEIRKELLAQLVEEKIAVSSSLQKVATKAGDLIPDFIGLFSKAGETFAKMGGAVLNAATDAVTDIALRGRRIVLDDLERRGADLTVIAVLGFIDVLRHNGSQVVVIFNDEKIRSSASGSDLMTFREKAFNVELEVRPSVTETYEIALMGINPLFKPILYEQYIRFGITNIRVGRRVVHAVDYIFSGQQTLSQDIVREAMPAIVAVTGLFYEALPDWPSLSEVGKEIAERGLEKELGKGRVRSRVPLDDLVDAHLNDVESEFFRLMVQHISTGDLLEQPFRDYWERRIIRRDADELYEDTFWSPSITADSAEMRGEDLMKQKAKLDRPTCRKLDNVFLHWGFCRLQEQASAVALEIDDSVEADLAQTFMGLSGNEFESPKENVNGVAELEKAMLAVSDPKYLPPPGTKEVVRCASTEMFQSLFGSTDRRTFRLSVLFLKEWLEENNEEWDDSIGTALRRVLAGANGKERYAIFHREIEIEDYNRSTISSSRFKALIRHSLDMSEATPKVN